MSEALKNLAATLHKADVESEDSNWYRVVVRKKSDFNESSLRLVSINDEGSIVAVIGVIKSKKLVPEVQAVRFLKKEFDTQSAQEWVANHYKD